MKQITAISLLGFCCLPLSVAAADTQFAARLTGNSEEPSISTGASGTFRAYVAGDGLHYELTYKGLEGGAVTQAHIHLGERHTNGGVMVWLCSNLPSPPTPSGVQSCPAPPARIVGIATAANVVGPAGQGVTAGEFAALIKALGNGTAYTNVHTALFQTGEIRASISRVVP
ncbi:MAG TPA: CHRD domain-containing protein [Lysobacter sp.]|nr:CHRD domain-containing protein [Lysobacter sp.]